MEVRAADNKDRWILSLDLATAKAKTIYTEHDDAWINNFTDDSIAWMKNGEDVYFRSEKDGYSHLYRVSTNGGEPTKLLDAFQSSGNPVLALYSALEKTFGGKLPSWVTISN